MARLPRLVLPGIPYHVTQRGNRREQTFFCDEDYVLHRSLLGAAARRSGAEVWSYCLMPNHVHMIVVPSDPDGLRATFADAHRRYTGHINARNRWTGHLWQGRFGAVAMDEDHLAAAARYVALNPVRARLVDRAEQWPWSSTRAHLAGKDDDLVSVKPLLDRYGAFDRYCELDGGRDEEAAWAAVRKAETTGRPVGTIAWLEQLEERSGRTLRPAKRGPKGKQDAFSKLSP